jgi:hypothetical protein
MRHRRIASLALVMGALFLVLVFLSPWLSHLRWLGWVFSPAVLVGLLVSRTHSPEQLSASTAMLVQSGLILALSIVGYALFQEMRHRRCAAKHFAEAAGHLARLSGGEPLDATRAALASLGRGLAEMNHQRQASWFLLPLPQEPPPDLDDQARFEAFARNALRNSPDHRVVRRTLRDLERALARTLGGDEARRVVAALRRADAPPGPRG